MKLQLFDQVLFLQENERSFPNTVDLIEYYMETELVLAGNKGSVVLTGPP